MNTSVNAGMSVASDGEEMFFSDKATITDKFKNAARQRSTPNVEQVLTIPQFRASDIKTLEIESSFCGIVIEPSDSDRYELILTGVRPEDKAEFQVGLFAGAAGTLKLVANGTKTLQYISIAQGNRVNTIVLRVPADTTLDTVTFHSDFCVGQTYDFAAKVIADNDGGDLTIKDEAIRGDYELQTSNGDIRIIGDQIVGPVNLETKNGSVSVTGRLVSGPIELTSGNGNVKVSAEVLGETQLYSGNGNVTVDIGRLIGDADIKSGNGNVKLTFQRKPEDFSFFYQKGNGRTKLPQGWSNGYRCGNGNHRLSLRAGNGNLTITVPETYTLQ